MDQDEHSFLVNTVEDKFLVHKQTNDGVEEEIIFDTCPQVRKCPRCSVMIYHESNCRWMACTVCKVQFCFVCGTDKCGAIHHYLECSVGYNREYTKIEKNHWEK